jgi:hypothetical protein
MRYRLNWCMRRSLRSIIADWTRWASVKTTTIVASISAIALEAVAAAFTRLKIARCCAIVWCTL